MAEFRVIDADGHCIERDAELAEFAEKNGFLCVLCVDR